MRVRKSRVCGSRLYALVEASLAGEECSMVRGPVAGPGSRVYEGGIYRDLDRLSLHHLVVGFGDPLGGAVLILGWSKY